MRVAVIPARGGSKRISRKNIKGFCGKPMIGWSIEAALQSGCFDRVVVSTDDEISEVARQHGAELLFVRPPELSDDHMGTIPVIRPAIEWFNYRITKLQTALGVSLMVRLDEYVTRRHQLAHRYDELLATLPVTTPWQHPDSYSGLHLYVICLQLDKLSRRHREVFDSLREQSIGVKLHYIPVHTQPYYQRMDFKSGNFPEAERYYGEAISLPLFPAMMDSAQDDVAFTVQRSPGL